MKKECFYIFGAVLLSGNLYSQFVGIGTTTPISALDIVTKTNLDTNKVLKVINTDGDFTLTGLDNGDFGIGRTLQYPVSQVTIFGINNNGITSQPSYNASYTGNPQRWGIYINLKQGAENPSYPGFASRFLTTMEAKTPTIPRTIMEPSLGLMVAALPQGFFL